MACGGCSSNRKYTNKVNEASKANKLLFGNYKYLSNKQLDARLSKYKRDNCKECDKRYECTYDSFLTCEEVNKLWE